MAELINPYSKQWKLELLEEIFSSSETTIIKIILISFANALDKLIWICIANGKFSMKSAYHLQKELNDLAIWK